jgi:hypothetical protein
VVGIVTLYLHHGHLPGSVRPSRFRTAGIWVATALIVAFGAVYLWGLMR